MPIIDKSKYSNEDIECGVKSVGIFMKELIGEKEITNITKEKLEGKVGASIKTIRNYQDLSSFMLLVTTHYIITCGIKFYSIKHFDYDYKKLKKLFIMKVKKLKLKNNI